MPYNKNDPKARERHRLYMQKWYQKNKQKHKRLVKNQKEKMMDWFKKIKSSYKCTRCTESHIACLDFHHKNEEEKEFSLGNFMAKSKEKILLELAKCECLCANCHRKLHHEKRNTDSRN